MKMNQLLSDYTLLQKKKPQKYNLELHVLLNVQKDILATL